MKGHYIRPPKGLSEIELFMRHVQKQPNGCWNWTASLKYPKRPLASYGQCKFRGKMQSAHRVSYILFNGEIPEEMCALHKCIGNPLCVNPDHLYPGTKKNNAEERKRQGREGNHKGDANGRAKVTEAMVIEMRKLRPPNHRLWTPSYDAIARRYGLSVSSTKQIINGYTWKHIPLDVSPNCGTG